MLVHLDRIIESPSLMSNAAEGTALAYITRLPTADCRLNCQLPTETVNCRLSMPLA